MELIFDLRGHMEQLHKEIFDLRKSLHTCMEMQVKLQHFMMREAESVKSHSSEYIIYALYIHNYNVGSYLIIDTLSAQNNGTGSINRIQRKGTCCLCFDAEVDSLLYRYLDIASNEIYSTPTQLYKHTFVWLYTYYIFVQMWSHVHLLQMCSRAATTWWNMSNMPSSYTGCRTYIY